MDINILLIDLLAKIKAGISERKALFQVIMSCRLHRMETERILTQLMWSLALYRMAQDFVPQTVETRSHTPINHHPSSSLIPLIARKTIHD